MALHGKKRDDPNIPLTYGNFQHLFILRLDPPSPKEEFATADPLIFPAGEEEIRETFSEVLLPKNPAYWEDKKELLFGFSMKNAEGVRIGSILAYPFEMGAPFDGTQWIIADLSAETEYRREVSTALLRILTDAALEQGISQLMSVGNPREENLFWHQNGFDIFDWHYLSEKNQFLCVTKRLK